MKYRQFLQQAILSGTLFFCLATFSNEVFAQDNFILDKSQVTTSTSSICPAAVIREEIESYRVDEESSIRITGWILSASKKQDVDPFFLTAVMEAESGFQASQIGRYSERNVEALATLLHQQAGKLGLHSTKKEEIHSIVLGCFQGRADKKGKERSLTEIRCQAEWIADIYTRLNKTAGM